MIARQYIAKNAFTVRKQYLNVKNVYIANVSISNGSNMTKEEFMKITTYEEFDRRRDEIRGIEYDKEMLIHSLKLFPKASNTKEELYGKNGTIGR